MIRRLAAVAACMAVVGCGGDDARPDAAARLVPAGALAYLHVDLGDAELARIARRFPSLQRLVTGLAGLAGSDLGSWAGDEAALALLDSGGPAADTLLLVEVEDAEGARRAARTARGVRAELVGDFLAVGQARVVRRAVDLSRGKGEGLDRTVSGAVDAWLPAAGVRRLVARQPGLVGALGAALDDPRLRSVSATAEAEEEGLRVELTRTRTGGAEAPVFEPSLLERVPRDAAGYLGLAGARELLRRLGMGALELGEVAIWAEPALPAPVLSLAAEVDDERAAREAAAAALERLAARMSGGAGAGGGRIPQLEQRELPGGLTASVLPLGPGVELATTVVDGVLLASTSPAGLARGPAGGGGLREGGRFRRALDDLPDEAEALGFADLAQLLTLGEQVGLAGGQAAGAAGEDLRRIRTVGMTARREGSDTTAEFFFEIP